MSITADGLTLFFASWGRPGGLGSPDIYAATRTSVTDPWQPAFNLGPGVNSGTGDGCPGYWSGGPTLFFISYQAGAGFRFLESPIEPIVDFNGDGDLNGLDLIVMGTHWDEDYSLCDIAPLPFGDGVVNIQDLLLFVQYMEAGKVGSAPRTRR